MKLTTKILILLIIVLNQSCINNDCEDNLCFAPPNPFDFELVDKTTGVNLFTNGTFNSNEIEILNTSDNSKIEYTFLNEIGFNIIRIGSIGWKSEIIECTLRIGDSEILRLYVNAKRLSENCCSFTRYDEIRIENTEYEYDNLLGVYKILVDVKRYGCITGEADSIVSSDQILGEWKIIGARNPWFVNRFYDYSNENIIYNFQSNGILLVTGNENHKMAQENGEYNYVFEKDYLSGYPGTNEPKIWLLKIEGRKWTHISKNDLMEIGQSYVDGSDYCLERKN